METSEILQYIVSGMMVGGSYALVALGFTIIYNATDILNFAQGSFVMLGGMIASVIFSDLGLNLAVAVLLAVSIVTVLSIGVYRFVIFPMRRSTIFAQVMATLGVAVILEAVALLLWGTMPKSLPNFTAGNPVDIAGAVVSLQAFWVIGIAALVMLVLHFFYKFSFTGLGMLACSIKKDMASVLGINVTFINLIAFGLGGALGALAGALIAPIGGTGYLVGIPMALKGFAAMILGGIGNSTGAVIGGILLGLLESFITGFISSGYRDAVAMVVIISFLVLRPKGLLGARE